MKRTLYNQLVEWKNSPARKPLILEGARQVGKTWLMKEFGKNKYENMVYVNCADEDFAKSLFLRDLKPDRILRDIVANTRQRIEPGNTLLIFDEIQEAPNGITSLKYFCEDAPEQHVIAAGSLLGVIHHPGESYPVGKVNILRLYPMSFEEFLWARGYEKLAEILKACEWESIEVLQSTLEDLLRQYFYVGGMPEAVLDWTTQEDVLNIREIQNRIINSYANDISKHAGAEAERIRMVWNSIPAQLAKDNKKFIYGAVKKGGRAKDFEVAIQWLVDAGLVIKVNRCNQPRQPLKFYMDSAAFKIYLLDCGLFATLCETKPSDMLLGDNAFVEFKGAFAENYVLQQITASAQIPVYYYSKDGSTQEVDFLVQTPDRVVPLEVKAEENVKSKSLSTFVKEDFKSLNLKGLRCSMKPYIDQGWMENIPLYAVEAYFAKS